MFDSIGWGEILVLALAALFIFGPERLPHIAKDAAIGLKKVRTAIRGVREQMNETLGDDLPELRNLDLRQYHPRTFIRTQLFEDEPELPTVHRNGSPAPATTHVRDAATPPPFDPDAT